MKTLGQIVYEVAPAIGTGLGVQSKEVRKLIRRAVTQILQKNPILLERTVELVAVGDVLVLPDEIRRVLKYRMNGPSSQPRQAAFEFLPAGTGMVRNWVSAEPVLIDRQYAPTLYQPPSSLKLAVLSDRDERDCVVVVRGTGEDGLEIRTENGTNGESVQLSQENEKVITGQAFKTVTSFIKPRTNGYVYLYAVDEENNAHYILGKYAPDQTIGHFRMYRLPGNNFNSSDEAIVTAMDALVILKEPILASDDDVVPVDSVLAIELVARGLDLLRKHKYKESQIEIANGMQIAKQSVDLDFGRDRVVEIAGDCFTMGDVDSL